MFQKVLTTVAKELRRRRIPYMIIGGQAVLVYGEPRLTKDIDITLGLGIDGLDRVKSALQKLTLRILVDEPEEFVQQTMVLPTIDDTTGIRVDFIFSSSVYEAQAIRRAVDVTVGTAMVKFASLEDVVIHKIIAGRARDLEDVKTILLKNPDYDARYIEEWLKQFDESLGETFLQVFQNLRDEIQ